jgi:hypothetical protein
MRVMVVSVTFVTIRFVGASGGTSIGCWGELPLPPPHPMTTATRRVAMSVKR